jgi:ACS family glucarate transporter-like MFS transporter
MQKPTSAPFRYLLVVWLGVLSAIAFLDRTNISVAGLAISREFAITNTRLGWVFSAFLIGYAGFQIPAGILARRLGPRRVLAFAGIWWACFTTLTAVIRPGFGAAVLLLIIVRFALGAGEATMYPAASQFVERWFPIAERGRANGIIFAGVGFGSAVTPYIVTQIMVHFGWRASFWISAVIGLTGALIWYVIARDTPEQHARISASEREGIVAARELATTEPRTTTRSIPWARLLRSREILALTLSYFTFGYVAWIYFAWLFIYLAQVRGLNLKTSATYTSYPFIAMTIGCLLGGVLSDAIAARFGLRAGRTIVPALALALTAVLLIIGSRTHEARSAALILAVGAGVLYLAQSGFWAVAADIGQENTSVASGIVNMGAQIGGASVAAFTPVIAKHFGWGMSFDVAAALAFAGGLAWLAINPHRQITRD